jgi:hypothetical protein
VLVFHLMDDDELDFPFSGPMRFEGLESVDYLNCNPRALREGYLEALGAFLDTVRRGCAQNTVDYALIRTSQPLDAALATYLSNRLGMHHRNLKPWKRGQEPFVQSTRRAGSRQMVPDPFSTPFFPANGS